ncbi:MAG: hypothetical protein ABGW69_02000 [Nanoarchaeota archaeon]
MINKLKEDIGVSAFFIGITFSLFLGIYSSSNDLNKLLILYGFTIISGFITGILNLNEKKLNNYLIASTALLVSIIIFNSFLANLQLLYLQINKSPFFIETIKNILYSLALFISSSTIFPALKRVLKLLEQEK